MLQQLSQRGQTPMHKGDTQRGQTPTLDPAQRGQTPTLGPDVRPQRLAVAGLDNQA